MKKILALLSFLILVSCSKNNYDVVGIERSISYEEAQTMFATILSKAVATNKQLRLFIKDTALKQFDKDYDVFYPYVKNEVVDNGKTFRELLLDYCDNDQLCQIEQTLPKLTILVPDWSWFGGSCAEEWNIEDNNPVYVGSEYNTANHILFCNGEPALALSLGEFPSSPTLIVKENERMKVIGIHTKSGDLEYSFVDSAFDGSSLIETKGRVWHEEYIDLPYETITDFVPRTDISQVLIEAYHEFDKDGYGVGCQRDYVYYSMTNANDTCGVPKDYIRERLYRFRISKDAFSRVSDQTGDPTLSEPIDIVSRNHELSSDYLLNHIWSGGAFEFRFDIYIGTEGSPSVSSKATIPVSAAGSTVFDLTRVFRQYKNTTMIAKGESIYTFKAEDLVPKWVYPDGSVYLPRWEISKDSNNIYIVVNEYDSSEEISGTEEHTFTFSKNFGWKVDLSAEGKLDSILVKSSLGINGGNNSQTSNKIQINTKYTKDKDLVGSGDIPFAQRILDYETTKVINGNEVRGFSVRPLSLGDISITLLPEDIRY